MNAPLSEDDVALPIDQLGAFLACHRPRLGDILAASCELYRINPDWLGEAGKPCDDRAAPAREMFLYCASHWAGHSYKHAGQLVGLEVHRANSLMGAFSKRLARSEVLRDDLHLIAVRLAECVLRRRRYL